MGLLFGLSFLILFMTYMANWVSVMNGIPDIMQILYPEKYVDNEALVASETLQAPFARSENSAETNQLQGVKYDPVGEENQITNKLNVPHMDVDKAANWAMKYTASSLTFSLQGYGSHKKELASIMSGTGMKEFEKFLSDAKVLQLMQSGRYDIRSSVIGAPDLVDRGVAGGRYSWVYDLPLSVTFLPVGTTSYEDLSPNQYVSEYLKFRVQLTRVEKGYGKDGLVIHSIQLRGRSN
jgi:hypothetical protein